jgi:hypothetical protein
VLNPPNYSCSLLQRQWQFISRPIFVLAFALFANTALSSTCSIEADGTIRLATDCTGVTWSPFVDSGPAVVAAMNLLNSRGLHGGGTLIFPEGEGLVNATINITASNVGLACAGAPTTCKIDTAIANLPQVVASVFTPGSFGPQSTLPQGITNLSISGLVFDRLVPATAGGDGIDLTGYVDWSTLDNVMVAHAWNNIVFGPASASRARNIFVLYANNDNIEFVPRAGNQGSIMQWDLDKVDSFGAARYGVYGTSLGAQQNGGFGEWRYIQTYDNGQAGVWIDASSGGYALSGVRIDDSWFCCSKRDGGGIYEVYLRLGPNLTTAGIHNHIANSSIELSPLDGLVLDGSVADFTFASSKINGVGGTGLISFAQKLVLTGDIFSNNGTKQASDGMDIYGPSTVISAVTASGNTGYGLGLFNDATYFSGGDLSGNVQGALTTSINPIVNSSFCAVNGISGRCK